MKVFRRCMDFSKSAIWISLIFVGSLVLNGCNTIPIDSRTSSPTLIQTTMLDGPTRIPLVTSLLTPTQTITPIQKPSSTLQPKSTRTLTPTQTPQGMHTWHPSLVLVQRQFSVPTLLQPPPELVIFSNGLVVIRDYSEETGFTPLGTQLNQNDLCKIMNIIDRYGFFEYDSSTYIEPLEPISGQMIEINAWKTNRVFGGDLYCWTYFKDPLLCCHGREEDSCKSPVVMPALENTYAFISSYHPEGLEPLQVNAIVVGVSDNSNFEGEDERPIYKKWPISEFPLEELNKILDENNGNDPFISTPLVFEGEDLGVWLQFMPNGIYQDGDFIARVYSRPLWPYENPFSLTHFANDDHSVIPEDFTLTCTYEDGWIE